MLLFFTFSVGDVSKEFSPKSAALRLLPLCGTGVRGGTDWVGVAGAEIDKVRFGLCLPVPDDPEGLLSPWSLPVVSDSSLFDLPSLVLSRKRLFEAIFRLSVLEGFLSSFPFGVLMKSELRSD